MPVIQTDSRVKIKRAKRKCRNLGKKSAFVTHNPRDLQNIAHLFNR